MKRRALLRPSVDIAHAGVIGGNSAIRRPIEIRQQVRKVRAAKFDIRSRVIQVIGRILVPVDKALGNHVLSGFGHKLHQSLSALIRLSLGIPIRFRLYDSTHQIRIKIVRNARLHYVRLVVNWIQRLKEDGRCIRVDERNKTEDEHNGKWHHAIPRKETCLRHRPPPYPLRPQSHGAQAMRPVVQRASYRPPHYRLPSERDCKAKPHQVGMQSAHQNQRTPYHDEWHARDELLKER